jgi:imidazolonepropionase-like amidohydrolase
MRPWRVFAFCAIVLVVWSLRFHAQLSANGVTLFEGARLIVGDGSEPIEHAAFIIENEKITRVGRQGQLRLPAGAARVDLTGKTVIPGLIDAHAHVGYTKGVSDAKENYTRENFLDILRRYAYSGVVAVESLGSDTGELPFALRDSPPQTDAAIYTTSGPGLAPPAQGPGPAVLKPAPYGVTTEAEARRDVQELAAKKVRIIKIWVDDRNGTVPKLSPALYRAIIDEGHKHNLLVIAHASNLADLKDLIRLGLDGSAHLGFLAVVDDELLALFKSHPKFFFTSLVGGGYRGIEPGRPAWFNDPLLHEVVPEGQIRRLGVQMAARSVEASDRARARWQQIKESVRKVLGANIRVAVGTDAGPGDQFFGWGVQYELEALVAAGFTPMQAIVAGTHTSAEIVGVKQLGAIADGKSADFIVLDANPLDDITNSRKINRVYLRGKEVRRSALRSEWSKETAMQ